jgi:1,4-alpha-glucan branching enzyme
MALGAFTFVLHSHIPYVLSHGRWPHGMDWLNEAVAETYIPLLNILHRLMEEGRSPRLTLGITPVLVEMLSHPNFNEEFLSYLGNKIRSANGDIDEFKKNGELHFQHLAEMWKDFYESIQKSFIKKYGGDLVGAFSSLQEKGYIEIITSAATHGYLPLLSEDTSVQAQIKQGIETYRHHFGKPPLA